MVTDPIRDGSPAYQLAEAILAAGRPIYAAKQVSGELWSQLDAAVMRAINRQPGITAGEAARRTHVISSNFSRTLRKLEGKGLVRRDIDADDARRVRLYPTEAADADSRHRHDVWTALLDDVLPDVVEDEAELDRVIDILRRLEQRLTDRTGDHDAHLNPNIQETS